MRPTPLHKRFTAAPLAMAAAMALAMAAGHAPLAHAQTGTADASAPLAIDIPAQPLGKALNELARQANLQMTFPAAMVAGKTAPSVTGQMTVRQALAQLLAGTGMTSTVGASAVVVQAIQPETTLPGPTLSPVTVTAAAALETANGPVRGYAAKRSATATKTDTFLVETPQSISVIGRDEMNDRGVNSVIDALQYVPGVITSQSGHDDRGVEWFNIRGFGSSHTANYLDGLRQMSSTYTIAQNEPYGLERIEVLRGPSSMLYGQSDAGGIINRVSKRPRADAVDEVEVQVGNQGRKLVAADLGGALDSQGELLYRLVSVAQGTRPQLDYPGYDEKHNKRTYIAPSLAWTPSAGTSFVLMTEYAKVRSNVNSVEYVAPEGRRTGVLGYEPAYDLFDQEQWSVGYQAEHRIDPNWTVRQNLRTSKVDMELRAVLSEYSAADDAGNLERYAYRKTESLRYTALDTQLQGRLSVMGMAHTVLFGADWTQSDLSSQNFFGTGPTLNIFNPVYGQGVDGAAIPLAADDRQQIRQLGFYAQDQIKLDDHWQVTVGLRRDEAKTEEKSLMANTSSSPKDSATTGRLAVAYTTASGLVPFASYTESFLPTVGADANSVPFSPTHGRQNEVGVKYQAPDGKGLVTLAVFDLRKTNVVTYDSSFVARQIGQVRSRGLEAEVKQKITRTLDVSAQYTHLDTEVTESASTDLGKQVTGTPRNLLSAWLNAKIQTNGLHGLGFGLGARYTGKRFNDGDNTYATPGHTLADAALSYDTGPWALAFNVHNLFDKDYAGNTGNPQGYYRGSRRTAVLNAKYKF
jgi:iron complex outermembrane receptor protein